MAGIGFLLKKLERENMYSSDIKATLYAMIVSSGPWLFAILCMAGLSAFSTPVLNIEEIYLFRVYVIYIYAFSLIVASIFQLVLTRYVSDRLYQREYSSLLPNFIGAMFLNGVTSIAVSSAYIYFTPLDFTKKMLFVLLFCSVSSQWIIMVFLSILRDYAKIAINFFAGYLLSFGAAIGLGTYFGINGYLMGFTIGQSLIVILLTQLIIHEFPLGREGIFEFTRYYNKYRFLAWSGVVYTIGLWIDKMVLWYSPLGKTIAGSFRSNFAYDTASFLAVLSIIPAMSIFFLQTETDFYEGILNYTNTILTNGTYNDIEKQRASITKLVGTKLLDIIKIQTIITLMVLLLGYNIVDTMGFTSPTAPQMFLIMLIGSFFQALFLITIVIYWYLEFLTESIICVTLFAILNTVSNLLLVHFTNVTPGVGYLVSTVVSFIVAMVILASKLGELNYIVFMKRPLSEGRIDMPKFD